jgi:hypothetical protein
VLDPGFAFNYCTRLKSLEWDKYYYKLICLEIQRHIKEGSITLDQDLLNEQLTGLESNLLSSKEKRISFDDGKLKLMEMRLQGPML